MFKTSGPFSVWRFACKTRSGHWYETSVEAASREHAKQVIIGREAPVRICIAL